MIGLKPYFVGCGKVAVVHRRSNLMGFTSFLIILAIFYIILNSLFPTTLNQWNFRISNRISSGNSINNNLNKELVECDLARGNNIEIEVVNLINQNNQR